MMFETLRALVRELRDSLDAVLLPRVLVVDAARERRVRVAAELRRLGCVTVEARTPLETVHRLEHDPGFHAVAIGPTLTQTRAHELAAFLRQAYPGLRVVIIADDTSPAARLGDALRDAAMRLRGAAGARAAA